MTTRFYCSTFPREVQDKQLANCILAFDAGHPFLNLAMQRYVSSFLPTINEVTLGPVLFTNVAREYLNHTTGTLQPPLNLVRGQVTMPISYGAAERQLANATNEMVEEKALAEAYTMHLWRNKLRHFVMGSIAVTRGSVLEGVVKQACPELLDRAYQHWMN